MLSLPNALLLTSENPHPPKPRHQRSNLSYGYGRPEGGVAGEGGSGKACRDCGNRAKKECRYQRCRTCCKSRRYDCPSHVRSTWVPASERRREKHGSASGGSSSFGGRTTLPALTRQLYAPSASQTASVAAASAPQDASFKESLPAKVRSPAVFRRIRVTAVSNGEIEIAYQATVTISGHVFKGFLYNHGVDEKSLFPSQNTQLHPETSNGGTNRKRHESRDKTFPLLS